MTPQQQLIELIKQQVDPLGYELIRKYNNLPQPDSYGSIRPWQRFWTEDGKKSWTGIFNEEASWHGVYFIAALEGHPPDDLSETSSQVIYIGQSRNVKTRLLNFWNHVNGNSGTHLAAVKHRKRYKDPMHLEQLWFSYRTFDRDCIRILAKIEAKHLEAYMDIHGERPLLNR